MLMLGTCINVGAIVLGGLLGLLKVKPLSLAHQFRLKSFLGLATVVCGLYLTWLGLNGTFWQILAQIGVVLISMTLGRLLGRLLRLQKLSNRVGKFARDRISAAKPGSPNQFSDGFAVCAALLCAAPLGLLGAVHDGLLGYFYPLIIKAAMDGIAVMGFVTMFGSGVIFSAIPVLVLQGTITLFCARYLLPFLQLHGNLADPVNATGGLLIVCVSLLIFEVRKVEVTDYLPSLAVAPFLTWLLLR